MQKSEYKGFILTDNWDERNPNGPEIDIASQRIVHIYKGNDLVNTFTGVASMVNAIEWIDNRAWEEEQGWE
jgi:hypothetical protein